MALVPARKLFSLGHVRWGQGWVLPFPEEGEFMGALSSSALRVLVHVPKGRTVSPSACGNLLRSVRMRVEAAQSGCPALSHHRPHKDSQIVGARGDLRDDLVCPRGPGHVE